MGLAVDTDGGSLHRFIITRTDHLESAQAIWAGQDEFTGAAWTCPNWGSHHLRNVGAIRRISNQIVKGLQEFPDF